MSKNIDTESSAWNEALDLAYQRASEEGDIDFDYDEELIFAWAEEYYDYLTN